MIGRCFILLLVSTLCTPVALADERAARGPRGPREIARAVLTATSEDAVATLAAIPQSDPFAVFEHALELEGHALTDPDGAPAFWHAMTWFAKAVGARESGAGFQAVVKSWQTAGATLHESENELRVALAQTTALMRRQEHAQLTRVVDEALQGDVSPLSLAAPQLRIRKAAAINSLRKGDARSLAASVLSDARARQWSTLEALALHVLTNAHHLALDLTKALESVKDELKVREKLGDVRRTGLARANLALLSWRGDERMDAIHLAQRAARELEAVGHTQAVLRLLSHVAEFRLRIGDAPRALKTLNEVIDRTKAPRLFDLHADALRRKARVLGQMGRLAQSRALLDRLLADERLSGPSFQRARVLADLAQAQYTAGEARDAGRSAREAVDFFSKGNYRAFANEARVMVADVSAALGEFHDALVLYRESSHALRAAGQVAPAMRAEVSAGWCLVKLERHDEARTVAESMARDAVGRKNPRAEASAHRLLGLVQQATGAQDGGIAEMSKALALLRRTGLDESGASADVRRALSKMHLAAGRHREAATLARSAVEGLLRRRAGLSDRSISRLLDQTYLSARVGIDAEAALHAMASTDDERARAQQAIWWFGEAQRSLILADSILNAGAYRAVEAPEVLLEAEDVARRAVRDIQQALLALFTNDAESATKIRTLRTRLAQARRILDRASAAVERAVKRDAALVRTPQASIDDARGWLPADGALVVYLRGVANFYAFVVTANDVVLRDLGNADETQRAAARYLDLVASPDGMEARLSQDLYERLLRPIEADLAGIARLIVSPFGSLNFVPFEALTRTDKDRPQRVVERWAVTWIPSATVMGLLRGSDSRGRGLIALGDPQYVATPRLTASGDEVRAIARLFAGEPATVLLREAASREALVAEIGARKERVRAIHLACHGFVDTAHPRLSGLELAGGSVLTVESLYHMRMNADLVVLSACDTGRGQTLRGEGVIGMTRGLFRAGAPRVVVSTWRINDRSTCELMTAFYRMHRQGDGAASDALRAAKLEMLRSDAHRHPFHWAAFQFWGRHD